MKRRSFFGILFGGLLCKFLPKPKINSTRVDTLDISKWGRTLWPKSIEANLDSSYPTGMLYDYQLYGIGFSKGNPSDFYGLERH